MFWSLTRLEEMSSGDRRGLLFGKNPVENHLEMIRGETSIRRKSLPVDSTANVNLVTMSMNPIMNVTRPIVDLKETSEEEDLEVPPGMEQRDMAVSEKQSGHEKMASKPKDSEGNEFPKVARHEQGTLDMRPREVYYVLDDPPPLRIHRSMMDDPMLHAPIGFEAAPQDRMKPDYTEGDCVPMHEWQTKSFPNCNLLHEYDLRAAGPGVYRNSTNVVLEDNLILLDGGWFRHTWRLNVGSTDESVVLKTLKYEREFYDEFYDLHRRDAVAMERLTHSPFVMDVYGYCGQSVLNELADFGNGKGAKLDKALRSISDSPNDPDLNLLKIHLAASVAEGVAHIHEIDGNGRPSMVHYDLNPHNVAVVTTGKPKLNDFNTAEFLHWNPKTNETCGFPSRLHEPWWRAPEEVVLNQEDRPLLNEKVDVYALGNLIFYILTLQHPRGLKNKKERLAEVREQVARGEPPMLEETYAKSTNPVVKAFREAMKLCFEPDPKQRGSAREVADILLTALNDSKQQRSKSLAGVKKG
jgi:serine/threonine protein kinase